MILQTVSLRQLVIEDEASFRHVALYQDLKRVLIEGGVTFRIPRDGTAMGWSRALFLNLTYWSAAEPSDVFMDEHVPADVVAHAAWHHLARRAVAGASMGADAMFLGEAIASAFDMYLVGRLLVSAPKAEFLETQVPAMGGSAADAGMYDADFDEMLQSVARSPERAFEDLRSLLFDASTSLVAATSVDDAADRLARFDGQRFAPLLHHYELSNWILYARAYAPGALAPDTRVRAVDDALRAAPDALSWLDTEWVQPALRSRR